MRGKDGEKRDEKEMPFLDHLEELRWRLLRCIISVIVLMILSFPFSKQILEILTYPNNHLSSPAKLIFLKPTGMLMVRLWVSVATGIILSLPVIFYQLWKFISPGLLEKERKYAIPMVLFTTLCFLAGVLFSYFILIPVVLPLLYGMTIESIEPTINISDYIGFVTRLILICGVVFEFPALSFFLTRVGILTPDFLKKYRKYGIVLIFVMAAILTPPDPLSQVLLALPLVVLYEVSIWISVFAKKKRRA